MYKQYFISLFFILFGLLEFRAMAQVSAGTYSIISLGTAGSHATDPGGKGTMTVSSQGKINGSLYSYADRSTSTFTGSVNLNNGIGYIKDAAGTIFDISAKIKSATWANISYTKRNSSSGSKGIVWGVR